MQKYNKPLVAKVVMALRETDATTQALALANWHRAYGFSPRTGEATTIGSAGWTRVGADGRLQVTRSFATRLKFEPGVPVPEIIE